MKNELLQTVNLALPEANDRSDFTENVLQLLFGGIIWNVSNWNDNKTILIHQLRIIKRVSRSIVSPNTDLSDLSVEFKIPATRLYVAHLHGPIAFVAHFLAQDPVRSFPSDLMCPDNLSGGWKSRPLD